MVYGIGFATLMCNEDTRLVYPAESCTTWVNHCFCGVIEPLMGPNWWLSAATFKTTDATYTNLVRFRLFSHPLRLGRNEWGSTASQLDMDILWFPSSYLEHLSAGPKPQMLINAIVNIPNYSWKTTIGMLPSWISWDVYPGWVVSPGSPRTCAQHSLVHIIICQILQRIAPRVRRVPSSAGRTASEAKLRRCAEQ